MRFFRKYDLVLPPAALLYGIFAWNMKYPGDGLPQTMMDNLVNGWLLITVLFAALSAGIGVAVGNATDEAKNSADFVAEGRCIDGVAEAVEKYCDIVI